MGCDRAADILEWQEAKDRRKGEVVLSMTRQRALELGLLTCGTCGHPENNHFSHDDRPCAHCGCKSYVEAGVKGVTLR